MFDPDQIFSSKILHHEQIFDQLATRCFVEHTRYWTKMFDSLTGLKIAVHNFFYSLFDLKCFAEKALNKWLALFAKLCQADSKKDMILISLL